SNDAGRRLLEDDRLLRDRLAGLGGMIRIVEPDGDEVANPPHARAQPLAFRNKRQPVDLGTTDRVEPSWAENVASDIRYDAGEIANTASRVNDPGFLAAGQAVA